MNKTKTFGVITTVPTVGVAWTVTVDDNRVMSLMFTCGELVGISTHNDTSVA